MRLVTTRRNHRGAHAVAVRINGRVLAGTASQLALWGRAGGGTTSSEATIEAAGNGCLRSAPSHAARRSLAPAR
jgi:hypothetical protein